MDKLLPCPFCGGEATLKTTRKSDGQISYDSSYVLCLDCRSTGLSFTKYYDVSQHPEQEAIAAWNRRAQPENEPLTLDELREMGGEPAYFQFGDGVQGWAVIEWHTESGIILYGPVADDHSEPDVDFINMEYDDPDGYFGLHLLGWRAYRYKPEEVQDER